MSKKNKVTYRHEEIHMEIRDMDFADKIYNAFLDRKEIILLDDDKKWRVTMFGPVFDDFEFAVYRVALDRFNQKPSYYEIEAERFEE